jgi:flavodoxin
MRGRAHEKNFTEKTRITIYYFSGAGNTQIICDRLIARFREFGYAAEIHALQC